MKYIYTDALSIVIPTYNRREELIRLLDSIFNENLENLYEIVIVNNCSDYDVESITDQYNSDKIRVQNNPFNVKMATNMMNSFFYCKTKWMWMISDDDVVFPKSISQILNRITENPKVGCLKFSTGGDYKLGLEKNVKVNNLEEFIDYYYNDKPIRRGNLVFGSNNVFNLENLYEYLGFGYEYSYSHIPHIIPVLKALNNDIPLVFCEETIIKYIHPGDGFWSFSKIGLGLSTLSHIPINLSKLNYSKFLNITMCATHTAVFLYLIKFQTNHSRKIYKTIYSNCYKYYLTPFQKIESFFFSLSLITPKLTKFLLEKIIKKVVLIIKQ
jgi:glycosyltransferase involved in cell wall biosynthesis